MNYKAGGAVSEKYQWGEEAVKVRERQQLLGKIDRSKRIICKVWGAMEEMWR